MAEEASLISPENGAKVSEPITQGPITVSPPKRTRSKRQLEWSRELGKRSADFKRKKRQMIEGKFGREVPPSSDEEPSAADQASDENIEPARVKTNYWWLAVPVTLIAAIVLCRCRLNKAPKAAGNDSSHAASRIEKQGPSNGGVHSLLAME